RRTCPRSCAGLRLGRARGSSHGDLPRSDVREDPMSSVLAILMEPAPYSTGLVRELRSAWPGELDVVYVGRNLSQVWANLPGEAQVGFLPEGNVAALRYILKRLSRSAYDLLHIAGWGHPILLGSMLAAAARGIPIIAETDTPP